MEPEELKKKVTISTKSNKTFLSIMTLDEVRKMKEKLEKTPDQEFVNLWSFVKGNPEENTDQANIRAGEIDAILVETVSNIATPPNKKVQIAQFTGQPA